MNRKIQKALEFLIIKIRTSQWRQLAVPEKKKFSRQSQQFTLIELLGVMVISAILVAITLEMGRQDPLKQNTRLIGSYIRQAQAQAVAKNLHVAAIISQDSEGFEQIGVYRWYFYPEEYKELFIDEAYLNNHTVARGSGIKLEHCEWTQIENHVGAKEANIYRNYSVIPGTKPVVLAGDPLLFNASVNSNGEPGVGTTPIPVNNANGQFIIFLFKPGGSYDTSYSSNREAITIGSYGNDDSRMALAIDKFNGKISYTQ